MVDSDPYAVLAERLEFPGSQRLHRILEHLMTPDEARMVEALPGTVADVVEKTNFSAERVTEVFDKLFVKGVIFPRGDYNRREYYRFARSAPHLHDASQAYKGIDVVKDRPYYEAWQDFVVNEMYPAFGKSLQSGKTAFQRVVPAYKSIIDLPGVLPYEDYRELITSQSHIVAVPCSCRYRTTAVDEHCEHTSEEVRWNCLQLARSADYNVVRGAGKELTADEAVALIDRIEDDGLVHVWPNSAQFTGVNTSCNCCRDCCMVAISLDQAGLPLTVGWEKSRFVAYVASVEDCSGCQVCVDRCQFDAIEMVKIAGSKKMKASVDEDKCYGCGVCVVKCEPGALKMKTVRAPEHIPAVAAAGH